MITYLNLNKVNRILIILNAHLLKIIQSQVENICKTIRQPTQRSENIPQVSSAHKNITVDDCFPFCTREVLSLTQKELEKQDSFSVFISIYYPLTSMSMIQRRLSIAIPSRKLCFWFLKKLFQATYDLIILCKMNIRHLGNRKYLALRLLSNGNGEQFQSHNCLFQVLHTEKYKRERYTGARAHLPASLCVST